MDRYRVASDYKAAYPEPLVATKGSALEVHRKDDEWPGWVWCTTTHGVSGWVPESWLQTEGDGSRTLLRDYTARELTVGSGEAVTATHTESGWAWVTNAAGHSGWVPLRHLVQE